MMIPGGFVGAALLSDLLPDKESSSVRLRLPRVIPLPDNTRSVPPPAEMYDGFP